MTEPIFSAAAIDETQLKALARRVAAHLDTGDVVLLKGPVGAGKSTFARSAIKSILLQEEDVPSPTFTLVQMYETTKGPLWHCDLYRANSALELEELGLSDAFSTAICMIEWPEVLGDIGTDRALTITLAATNDGMSRSLDMHGNAQKWAGVTEQLKQ